MSSRTAPALTPSARGSGRPGGGALKQGIHIRDPSKWRDTVDFAAPIVAKDGWRQWYGARDVGIRRWDGIGKGQRGASLDDLGQGADSATKSVSALSDKLDTMPDATDQFTSSLAQLGAKLENASFGGDGGGFRLPGLGGLGGGGGSSGISDAVFSDGAGVFGFANGGYTGPGHRLQPAGLVHAGEYVIKASAVSRLPRPFLDGLNGYADGGLVMPGGLMPLSMDVPIPPANDYAPTMNVTHSPTINIHGGDGLRAADVPALVAPLLQHQGKLLTQGIQRDFSGMQAVAHRRFPAKR